jgi:hypothetical protein
MIMQWNSKSEKNHGNIDRDPNIASPKAKNVDHMIPAAYPIKSIKAIFDFPKGKWRWKSCIKMIPSGIQYPFHSIYQIMNIKSA